MLKNQWSKKKSKTANTKSIIVRFPRNIPFEAVKDGNIEAVSKNLKEEAFTNPEGMGILSKNPDKLKISFCCYRCTGHTVLH